MLELIRRFEPEQLAALGWPGVAGEITQLPSERSAQEIAAHEQVLRGLAEHRAQETLQEVQVDLEALILLRTWTVDRLRLEASTLLPYVPFAQQLFSGFLALLTAGVPKSPAASVHRRLRRYAGLEEGYIPLAQQAQARIRDGLRQGGLLGPWREAVLEDLRNAPSLLAAVRDLFEEHRLPGTAKAYGVLRRQFEGYDTFLRQEILPQCRDDFRLPGELYAARLLQNGVEWSAEELSRRAEAAFEERRRPLDELAARVARVRGWAPEPFPGILRRLERERLAAESLVDQYRQRHRQLEQLIERMSVVTLPRRRLAIRLASPAESSVLPFPHLRWPPVFDPSCRAGELVLPAPSQASGGEDANLAAAWVIAAHEGVPGHALQISRLLEPDVSLARGCLGHHPAALEGWAVYAGSELISELPLEARFLALHRDLRRAAVGFLDPALHLGRLSRQQATHFLRSRVGLTERAAQQTLWRIIVWNPGQAASYFYGQSQLAALRAAVECRLGSAFDRREYHDFLLSQGLLPLTLLRRQVLECIAPERQRAA